MKQYTHTDMDLKSINDRLERLTRFVGSWSATGEIPAVEKDIAMRYVREVYEILQFGDSVQPVASQREEPKAEPKQQVSPAIEKPKEESNEDSPEIEVELILDEQSEEDDNAEESSVEDNKKEIDLVIDADGAGIETILQSVRDDVIASLYGEPTATDNEETVEPSAGNDVDEETEAENEIVVYQADEETTEEAESNEEEREEVDPSLTTENRVLGETFEHATLGETIVAAEDVSSNMAITSLASSLSINDRFLIQRDLFAGDEQAFEQAIEELDEFDTLDDCLIYISENYSWPTSSNGAKLIMGLLQRKFK